MKLVQTAQQREMARFNIEVIDSFMSAVYSHCLDLNCVDVLKGEDRKISMKEIEEIHLFFMKAVFGSQLELPKTLSDMRNRITQAVDNLEDNVPSIVERWRNEAMRIVPLIREIAETSLQKAEEYQRVNFPLGRAL